jgi:hypothetical protein
MKSRDVNNECGLQSMQCEARVEGGGRRRGRQRNRDVSFLESTKYERNDEERSGWTWVAHTKLHCSTPHLLGHGSKLLANFKNENSGVVDIEGPANRSTRSHAPFVEVRMDRLAKRKPLLFPS